MEGVGAGIYRPEHQFWTLGSNRLKRMVEIRQWRTDIATEADRWA
jgi:hypothetical protein